MNITLLVDPTSPGISRAEFEASTPPYSIALDGYVGEGPWYNEEGPYRNFNHHEDVDRLATRATCGQVQLAIRQGLFDRFREDNVPTAHVYVNDCDEDVCLSWFLLNNAHITVSPINPLLNRLVDVADKLDATAGAYSMPADSPVLNEMAWVFNPYRQFRASGGLVRRDPAEFRSVVESVEMRIMRYVVGQGRSIPLDTRYERIGGGDGWVMVKEVGAQSRSGMFGDGIRAFLSIRDSADGRYDYVVGRKSDYVPFPIPKILAACNAVEGCTSADLWGGGTTIGGSPRVGGSRLPPQAVTEIIEDVMRT